MSSSSSELHESKCVTTFRQRVEALDVEAMKKNFPCEIERLKQLQSLVENYIKWHEDHYNKDLMYNAYNPGKKQMADEHDLWNFTLSSVNAIVQAWGMIADVIIKNMILGDLNHDFLLTLHENVIVHHKRNGKQDLITNQNIQSLTSCDGSTQELRLFRSKVQTMKKLDRKAASYSSAIENDLALAVRIKWKALEDILDTADLHIMTIDTDLRDILTTLNAKVDRNIATLTQHLAAVITVGKFLSLSSLCFFYDIAIIFLSR